MTGQVRQGLCELPNITLNVGDVSILRPSCRAGNHFNHAFGNLAAKRAPEAVKNCIL